MRGGEERVIREDPRVFSLSARKDGGGGCIEYDQKLGLPRWSSG